MFAPRNDAHILPRKAPHILALNADCPAAPRFIYLRREREEEEEKRRERRRELSNRLVYNKTIISISNIAL